MQTMEHALVTFNARDPVRDATLEGREHWVVPMAMMTEGVWSGSNGPLFYSRGELTKAVPAWNYRPIVVYHPIIDGKGVSAATPEILNTTKIGVVLNAKYDDKQRAEAWIDKERAAAVDPRVSATIVNRERMELSTGLIVDRKDLETEMTFNGKTYKAEAVHHRPDHLAVLPDQLGAYSLADGGGLLTTNSQRLLLNCAATLARGVAWNTILNKLAPTGELAKLIQNELSHNNVWGLLSKAMTAELNPKSDGPSLGWIEDVYEDYFVYSKGDRLYKRGYIAKETSVDLAADSFEVARITEYRELKREERVGNSVPTIQELIAARVSSSKETLRGRVASLVRK